MTQKLVSKRELKSIYGVPYCFAHIARLEAVGQFPKRVRLGNFRGSRVGWIESEIRAWLQERIDSRDTAP